MMRFMATPVRHGREDGGFVQLGFMGRRRRVGIDGEKVSRQLEIIDSDLSSWAHRGDRCGDGKEIGGDSSVAGLVLAATSKRDGREKRAGAGGAARMADCGERWQENGIDGDFDAS
ncbi:hypothetical protein M0R45_018815 [Rubus argutus]|uniref:Uncharacterized protein n=1 Tax=Rubus argutus TaxID=59490 RepID=A0AAW1X5Z9_RUBAR